LFLFLDDPCCPAEDEVVSMETGLTPTPRRNDFSGKDIFTYFGHRPWQPENYNK